MLSVVVGTYNRRDQLQRAVESIIAQTTVPFTLYVTDAGSTDGTMEYLDSIRSERIRPILVGERLGQARAYNDVFAIVDTPYVCWLSDDNVVVNRGLDSAIEILKSDPQFGMVGLKVKDIIGPFADESYIGGISSVGILNVNQGVLPTHVLREVGGFSEEFRDYGIDPDLTAKVLLAGYDIVFTRNISLHHYRNWEIDTDAPGYFRMQERQRAYHALYEQTYGSQFSWGTGWYLKRAVWKLARRGLGITTTSRGRFLGLNARDWQNCLAGRYISPYRELTSRDDRYHLKQSAGRVRRTTAMKCAPDSFPATRTETR